MYKRNTLYIIGKRTLNPNYKNHFSYNWFFSIFGFCTSKHQLLKLENSQLQCEQRIWTATSVQISQMAFCAIFWVLYNYLWHCSLTVGVNVLKHYILTWIQTCSTMLKVKAAMISAEYVALGLRLFFLMLSTACGWDIFWKYGLKKK